MKVAYRFIQGSKGGAVPGLRSVGLLSKRGGLQ